MPQEDFLSRLATLIFGERQERDEDLSTLDAALEQEKADAASRSNVVERLRHQLSQAGNTLATAAGPTGAGTLIGMLTALADEYGKGLEVGVLGGTDDLTEEYKDREGIDETTLLAAMVDLMDLVPGINPAMLFHGTTNLRAKEMLEKGILPVRTQDFSSNPMMQRHAAFATVDPHLASDFSHAKSGHDRKRIMDDLGVPGKKFINEPIVPVILEIDQTGIPPKQRKVDKKFSQERAVMFRKGIPPENIVGGALIGPRQDPRKLSLPKTKDLLSYFSELIIRNPSLANYSGGTTREYANLWERIHEVMSKTTAPEIPYHYKEPHNYLIDDFIPDNSNGPGRLGKAPNYGGVGLEGEDAFNDIINSVLSHEPYNAAYFNRPGEINTNLPYQIYADRIRSIIEYAKPGGFYENIIPRNGERLESLLEASLNELSQAAGANRLDRVQLSEALDESIRKLEEELGITLTDEVKKTIFAIGRRPTK